MEADNFDQQIEALGATITDRSPLCSGVLPLTTNDLILFYGKDEPNRVSEHLNFADATSDQLKHLSDTCNPASFGLNQQDVLDPSYRNAGKLDRTQFATLFDVVHSGSGLLDTVRYGLFEGKDSKKPIYAELYKLNVYGPGSYFKAHKDTPRGGNMFGSLVVIFPTAHDGGVLSFRREDKEWSFDSAQIVRDAASAGVPCIAYAAFYSEIEHEVSLVTSGYRVSVTYNLYFEKAGASGSPAEVPAPEALSTIQPEHPFKTMLKQLLEDANFLSEGGLLGFGLRHEYPIDLKKERRLSSLVDYLKGSDALIMAVCNDLGLHASPKLIYAFGDDDGMEIMFNKHFNFQGEMVDDELWRMMLMRASGAKVIGTERDSDSDEYGDSGDGYYPSLDEVVNWVTPKTQNNEIETTYIAHGNEASFEYSYGRVSLIVEVGPAGKRTDRQLL